MKHQDEDLKHENLLKQKMNLKIYFFKRKTQYQMIKLKKNLMKKKLIF